MLIARFTDCKASSRHFKTPLTSTTAVRMQAEGAATTEARPEARISGPDMTGIAIRQLMPLVHGTRAAHSTGTACWIKDSRMTGRVPSSSPAPLSAPAHTSGGQRQLACDAIVLSCSRLQIADCRFQTMGADFRFGDPDFRFQISDGEGVGGGGNLAHEGEGCGSLQEACPEVVQR